MGEEVEEEGGAHIPSSRDQQGFRDSKEENEDGLEQICSEGRAIIVE
jgi:hypothetical protein